MTKAVISRTRSISISRVLQFFREGNADEVRAIMPLVIEAVGARHLTINAPIAVAPDVAPSELPKQRRHRRTKAELAAAAEQARLNSAPVIERGESVLTNWPDDLTKGAGAGAGPNKR